MLYVAHKALAGNIYGGLPFTFSQQTTTFLSFIAFFAVHTLRVLCMYVFSLKLTN